MKYYVYDLYDGKELTNEKNEKLGPYLKKNCIDCEVFINVSKR